jgi:hypothetical protein
MEAKFWQKKKKKKNDINLNTVFREKAAECTIFDHKN